MKRAFTARRSSASVPGVYYFVPKEGKKQLLSRDLGEALAKYGPLIGSKMSLRTLGDVIDKYRVEVLPYIPQMRFYSAVAKIRRL